ncbi:MAG: cation diffusion facilitator family transporter, partial [Peptococcaceae bacterium]|nr:cation diffusion facilitator family transporter [Peptococcaceae bacterium]
MTQLLLRLFIPDYQDVSKSGVRSAVGKLAGIVGILCNIILFAGKLLAGMLSGSVAIIADAMNNLSDASSSIVTLVGFRLAEKPADEDHPYGHARYEYLAGLAVAAIIVVIGFELAKSSVDKILHPAAVSFTLLTAGILAASMLVKLWMMRFNHVLGQTIH